MKAQRKRVGKALQKWVRKAQLKSVGKALQKWVGKALQKRVGKNLQNGLHAILYSFCSWSGDQDLYRIKSIYLLFQQNEKFI